MTEQLGALPAKHGGGDLRLFAMSLRSETRRDEHATDNDSSCNSSVKQMQGCAQG
jgi:hypothetical protein